jgi:hypothetical protein
MGREASGERFGWMWITADGEQGRGLVCGLWFGLGLARLFQLPAGAGSSWLSEPERGSVRPVVGPRKSAAAELCPHSAGK